MPRFERETAFSVVVTGIPDDLPGGVLTVEPLADEPAVDGSLDRSAARVPMVRFRLRSSAQEHALAELSFRDIGDGDLAHVAAARLYRDDDGDGYPDTEGDYADPIAEGTVDPATRRVSFSELWLPRHIDERFILTYDLDRPGRRSAAAAAGVRAAPWARWAPALLLAPLALLLLWRARKRRLVAAAVCGVALLAVALVGCPGDDEDDFVPGAYQVELELDRASAVGATGKAPFTVEGESVRGPRYRLE